VACIKKKCGRAGKGNTWDMANQLYDVHDILSGTGKVERA
jgi:hypothetical protein